MKKLLKWIGILLLIIIIVGIVAFFTMKGKGGDKLTQTYTVDVTDVQVLTDSAALARGAHLVNVACKECHGENLAGMALIDDESFGKLYAPNLTPGQGGCGNFTVTDWVRAMRHGVAPDGTSLMIMPSISFQYFSDYDLGAMIGYLQSLEPIDGVVPKKEFVPFIQFLLGVGAFDSELQAMNIDHGSITHVPQPNLADPMEQGDYLHRIAGCNHCHGKDMAGAKSGDPDSPPAPNITKGGKLANWTQADFITAMRTGKTPEGIEINPRFMPINAFKRFTDQELQDIYTYIAAQPALPDAVK